MKMWREWTMVIVLNTVGTWAIVTDQIPNRDSVPLLILFLAAMTLSTLLVSIAQMMSNLD